MTLYGWTLLAGFAVIFAFAWIGLDQVTSEWHRLRREQFPDEYGEDAWLARYPSTLLTPHMPVGQVRVIEQRRGLLLAAKILRGLGHSKATDALVRVADRWKNDVHDAGP